MWVIRLSPIAETDIAGILAHSEANFGEAARLRYEALLEAGLRDLAADPLRIGVKRRNELGAGVCTYHLFYSRKSAGSGLGVVRRPRHLIVFRLIGATLLDIGRVLHDAMELAEHVPNDGRALDWEEAED